MSPWTYRLLSGHQAIRQIAVTVSRACMDVCVSSSAGKPQSIGFSDNLKHEATVVAVADNHVYADGRFRNSIKYPFCKVFALEHLAIGQMR